MTGKLQCHLKPLSEADSYIPSLFKKPATCCDDSFFIDFCFDCKLGLEYLKAICVFMIFSLNEYFKDKPMYCDTRFLERPDMINLSYGSIIRR